MGAAPPNNTILFNLFITYAYLETENNISRYNVILTGVIFDLKKSCIINPRTAGYHVVHKNQLKGRRLINKLN